MCIWARASSLINCRETAMTSDFLTAAWKLERRARSRPGVHRRALPRRVHRRGTIDPRAAASAPGCVCWRTACRTVCATCIHWIWCWPAARASIALVLPSSRSHLLPRGCVGIEGGYGDAGRLVRPATAFQCLILALGRPATGPWWGGGHNGGGVGRGVGSGLAATTFPIWRLFLGRRARSRRPQTCPAPL